MAEAAARAEQAAPAQVQHALDEANERLQPVAQKARDQATRLVAAVTAAVLVLGGSCGA